MTEQELDEKIRALGKRCCNPDDKEISRAVDKNTLYAMRFANIIVSACFRVYETLTQALWRPL